MLKLQLGTAQQSTLCRHTTRSSGAASNQGSHLSKHVAQLLHEQLRGSFRLRAQYQARLPPRHDHPAAHVVMG